jgi:hexokinase
VSFSA